jgi:hypothetical protein
VPVASAVLFISKRLKFSGWKQPAPFPSVLVYCGLRRQRFIRQFGDLGLIAEFTVRKSPQLVLFADMIGPAKIDG